MMRVFGCGLMLAASAWAQMFEHAPDAVRLRASVVKRFALSKQGNWQLLEAEKENGDRYRVWVETGPAGGAPVRYVAQDGDSPEAREYRHAVTGEAVLPAMLPWKQLWPEVTTGGAGTARYLGHRYVKNDGAATAAAAVFAPPPTGARVVLLRPDLLVGQPHNTRQRDETRRFDQSDYEYVKLTREDYRAMAEAGVNCVNVDAEQLKWAEELGLYYWGPGGAGLKFPEMLYRSQYLGPTIFLDEPAVGTRDHVLRPRLAKDPAFRRAITPQAALAEFQKHYAEVLEKGAPAALRKSLERRPDVDLGDLKELVQHNLYSWETMPDTALWQLAQDARMPEAFVFEPPGRIGARRTLPEIDMTYGVTLPPDDPRALTSILYGFLRGAARATGKQWGVSIYGQVDRADAPFWLTHAYDLGATRFFFWSSYQLACVPFGEVLAHARHLQAHARQQPRRDLTRLRRAAETAILLPPGYGLGHVQTGKGSLWGINELNLERVNRRGVKHRVVMSNFFREIERAWRAGESFDLMWDVAGVKVDRYRKVARVREEQPLRAPLASPPEGEAPRLTVLIVAPRGAQARVEETTAPVWYTIGADDEGVYRNAAVAWEWFGPGEEDYVYLMPDKLKPDTRAVAGGGVWEASTQLPVEREGRYRLRAATVDRAGRSTVVWRDVTVVRGADGQLTAR